MERKLGKEDSTRDRAHVSTNKKGGAGKGKKVRTIGKSREKDKLREGRGPTILYHRSPASYKTGRGSKRGKESPIIIWGGGSLSSRWGKKKTTSSFPGGNPHRRGKNQRQVLFTRRTPTYSTRCKGVLPSRKKSKRGSSFNKKNSPTRKKERKSGPHSRAHTLSSQEET